MKAHKHMQLARRKMGHIIDEIYTALLHYGSEQVDLRILRQEEGLKLFVRGDFLAQNIEDVNRMCDLLQPQVRSEAMVEMYWELAGEDQYTGESKTALVGQMADEVRIERDGLKIAIEIFVAY